MSDETKDTTGAEETKTQETDEGKESQDVKDTSEKKESKETKSEKKSAPTISELMKAQSDKETVGEKKSTETKSEEGSKEEDKVKEEGEKKPSKKSASDEIRDLRKRAQDAESRAKKAETASTEAGKAIERIKGLEEKIASFEKTPEGKIHKKNEVSKQVDLEKLREDMEDQDFSDEQIDLHIDAIKKGQKVDGLETTVKALQDRLDAKDKAEKDKEAESQKEADEAFQEEVHANYAELSKGEYAYMFEKSDSDNGGFPKMKPEFDEKAMKIVELTSVERTNKEGEKVWYSPLLLTKEGLAMLMREVSREYKANQKAKDKIENEKNLAKKGVLTPSSNTKGGEKKSATMSERMATEAKRIGG